MTDKHVHVGLEYWQIIRKYSTQYSSTKTSHTPVRKVRLARLVCLAGGEIHWENVFRAARVNRRAAHITISFLPTRSIINYFYLKISRSLSLLVDLYQFGYLFGVFEQLFRTFIFYL